MRPRALQSAEITPGEPKRLLANVEAKIPKSMLWSHIGPLKVIDAPSDAPNQLDNTEGIDDGTDSIADSAIEEDAIAAVAEKCSEFLWLLNQVRKRESTPYEVPGTEGQRKSDVWHLERRYRCTASSCKEVLGLHKDSAKIRYLRNHVWGKSNFRPTWNMQYGIDHEDEARNDYEKKVRNYDPDAFVVKCGLWINPMYPQLCCSPDGLVITSSGERILLEIKCLTLTYVDPEKFEELMPPEKQKNFYLHRLPGKGIALKEHHQYHHQIQMSLDILELNRAHLFVWSESGSAAIEVQRNPSFFTEKRERLISFHRNT